MKKALFILIIAALFFPFSLHAQLEKVVIEKYYVSDNNDSTDTLGGFLAPGSVTYRIYIDMQPGYKLIELFGDANHALKFSSTANFFNNAQDGVSFAKDMVKSRLSEGTVALDTWLTLGQVTKKAAKTYFGVLKPQDRDGSIIGGPINNDGGSLPSPTGLLVNADSSAGIPLTTNDGLDTMALVPAWVSDNGFVDQAGIDSTIFGSVIPGSLFSSNNASVKSKGVRGVNPDSNQVLVAQLTTKGQITFELNIRLLNVNDSLDTITYVASKGAQLLSGETIFPSLKYPPECGCRDANYLEYDANFGCDNHDSCKTPIVFGCMDTSACNYDPHANFNIQLLCCYPGLCYDRDLSVVCPKLSTAAYSFSIYPNPAEGQMRLKISDSDNIETKYVIYNSFGRVITEKDLGVISGSVTLPVDLTNLGSGIYMFRLFKGDSSESKMFMKN